MCLMVVYFKNKKQIKTMIAICAGVLIYEIEQNWTARTFDYYDIIASLLGLGISIIIFNLFSVKYLPEDENISK